MSKILKNVLDKHINVPKSYTRYLSCKVLSCEDTENIQVRTPKGTVVLFKVENDALKRIGNVPSDNVSADGHNKETHEVKKNHEEDSFIDSQTKENVVFISLQEWNEIQKKWEETQELKKHLEKIEKKIESIHFDSELTEIGKRIENIEASIQTTNSLPIEPKVTEVTEAPQVQETVTDNKWHNLEEKLNLFVERLENLEKSSKKEIHSLDASQSALEPNFKVDTSKVEEKILQIEARLQKIEQRSSFVEKNKQYIEKVVEAARNSESVNKAKEKSKSIGRIAGLALVRFLKYLFTHPKISLPIALLIAIFIFQPWQYMPSFSNTTSGNGTGNYINYDTLKDKNLAVSKNKEDYIIPKDKDDYIIPKDKKDDTTSKLTTSDHLDEAREKEYLVWRKEQEKIYIDAKRQVYNVPELNKWLQNITSNNESEQIEAIREIGNSDHPDAAGSILKMLDHRSEGVRWQTIRGLGKLRYTSAVYGLLQIAENKRETHYLRIESILTIAQMNTTKTVYPLKKIMLDQTEDNEIRANAIVSLGEIGDANVSPDLLNVLTSSKEPLLQQASIRALGLFGYPPAYTVIIDVLKTIENIDIQVECIRALGNIKNKANKIAPVLIEFWEKQEYDLQESLKESLTNLKPYLDDSLQQKITDILN